MCGPGEYRPDPSAGITAPADLPQPEIVPYSLHDIRQPCPRCGHSAYRDKQSHRTLHDLGKLDGGVLVILPVTYSQHYCTKCRKYFSADLSDLAPPGSQYTHRVIDLAVRSCRGRLCPIAQRVGTGGATIASLCPLRPFRTGSAGEKRRRRAWTPTSLTGRWRFLG